MTTFTVDVCVCIAQTSRQQEGACLDAAQVHGVVTAAMGHKKAPRQALHLIPMPPQGACCPPQHRHALQQADCLNDLSVFL